MTWGIFKGARHLFLEGERFQLVEINITPAPHASSFINHRTLTKLTGFQKGESIFSYDLAEIKKNLESLPEVRRVSLTRRLPGTLSINLEERSPVAKLKTNGALYIIDEKGFCFQSSLTPPAVLNSLPQLIPLYSHDVTSETETQHLSDIGLQRAVNLLSTWRDFHVNEKPLSVKVKDYHSLEMITENDSRLLFGYYEHERQIQDFLSLKSYSLNTGRAISVANLLPYKNIPVKFGEAQKSLRPTVKKPLFHTPVAPRVQEHQAVEDDVLLILEQG